MDPQTLLAILQQTGRLKTTYRHCFFEDRQESVADHSWRIALMAMLLIGNEEYQEIDFHKVIMMCLIHDLGETFTGDIPTFQKNDDHRVTENELFSAWVASFPEPQKTLWESLLLEMEEQATQEAKLFKALDKIEALISHNESPLSTWLDLEYDLQLTYGKKEMAFSPYMTSLRAAVDEWSIAKMSQEKNLK
ncbi:MAG: HD domain-containing protein [bacterium]